MTNTPSRMRLDDCLIERGFFPDRDAALRAILAGEVHLDTVLATSAGMKVSPDVTISVAGRCRYVSRGGYKLEGALDAFGCDVEGLSCLDCGASTGGFSDCLLQHGAASVCAVDVGYGQFAWSLRQDPRVRLFERTNIRSLEPSACGAPFDLAVADISFSPLRSYLESVVELLKPDGSFITLVKPQFEVAKGQIGAHGVVCNPQAQILVLQRAMELFEERGLSCRGLTFSPIRGPMGNIEFLLFGTRCSISEDLDPADVVDHAWMTLGENQR